MGGEGKGESVATFLSSFMGVVAARPGIRVTITRQLERVPTEGTLQARCGGAPGAAVAAVAVAVAEADNVQCAVLLYCCMYTSNIATVDAAGDKVE